MKGAVSLTLVILLLAACGGDSSGDPADTAEIVFVRQIDGGATTPVTEHFTADELQTAVITDRSGPGHDQGAIIFFAQNGKRLVTYRCPLPSPEVLAPLSWEGPGSYLDHQCGTPGTLTPFLASDGRRFIAFTTHGGRSPSSLTVLEAVERTRLEPRVILWNQGHLHQVAQQETIVAALGFNARTVGEFSRYGAILLVVDLADLPAETPAVLASPPEGPSGSLPAPAKYVLTIPIDHPEGAYERDVVIEDRKVRALMISGLTYVLDLDEGTFDIEITDSYREEYALRKNSEKGLPATPEARIGDLRSQAVLHSRAR